MYYVLQVYYESKNLMYYNFVNCIDHIGIYQVSRVTSEKRLANREQHNKMKNMKS